MDGDPRKVFWTYLVQSNSLQVTCSLQGSVQGTWDPQRRHWEVCLDSSPPAAGAKDKTLASSRALDNCCLPPLGQALSAEGSRTSQASKST